MIGRYVDLGNPVADHPLNYGLVSWWLPLPNNQGGYKLFDVKAGNHGNLLNGVSWSCGPNAVPAVYFDGVDDWFLSASTFGLSGAYARTLSGYVRVLSWPGNGGILRIGPENAGTGVDFSLETRSSPGNAAFNGWFADYNFSTPSDGSWFHLCSTYDGSVHTTYVNGILANSASFSLNTTDIGLAIGSPRMRTDRTNANDSQYVNMYLATAMLHNRALSAGDVWSLYDQSRRNHPDTLRRFSRTAYLFGQTAAATSYLPQLSLLGAG